MPTETLPSPAESSTGRVLTQARFEAGILVRNGEQLLVALVLPAMAMIALVASPYPALAEPRIHVVAPGVLALAIVSTAFTGQAIQTAFDRRYGVLRFLATTPVGTDGLLAGKAVGITVVVAGQLTILGAVGLVLGWRPAPAGLLQLPVTAALGVWVFVALALLMAGALRAEAVLAIANLVWVLLAGIGGLLLPGDTIGALAPIVRWLPSGALGDALRDGLMDADVPLLPWAVLIVWGLVLSVLVVRTFRWRD